MAGNSCHRGNRMKISWVVKAAFAVLILAIIAAIFVPGWIEKQQEESEKIERQHKPSTKLASNSKPPFEIRFLREPGMMNYGILSPDFREYDPHLPGFHILGQLNGFIQIILKPTSAKLPKSFILSLQGAIKSRHSTRENPVIEPVANFRDRTELWYFIVKQGNITVENQLSRKNGKLIVSSGPKDYFRYDIVNDSIHVVFLPKAMAMLKQECRIVWAHNLLR